MIFYVELTLKLPDHIRTHFRIAALIVVVIGCTLTVLLALWETRTLRRTLRQIRNRAPISPSERDAAGREAVVFATRHHWHEAWLVPCSTLLPVLITLKLVDNASTTILINITVAVFMGIAMALMSTLFLIERCQKPSLLSNPPEFFRASPSSWMKKGFPSVNWQTNQWFALRTSGDFTLKSK